MSLDKLPQDYRFTPEDLENAWELWLRDWQDEELSDDAHEFIFLVFEAERFNHINKIWPTLAQVRDFAEARRA
jgi:hypothetical protein